MKINAAPTHSQLYSKTNSLSFIISHSSVPLKYNKLEFSFVTVTSPISPVQLFDRHFIPSHPLNLQGQKDNYLYLKTHMSNDFIMCPFIYIYICIIYKEYNFFFPIFHQIKVANSDMYRKMYRNKLSIQTNYFKYFKLVFLLLPSNCPSGHLGLSQWLLTLRVKKRKKCEGLSHVP